MSIESRIKSSKKPEKARVSYNLPVWLIEKVDLIAEEYGAAKSTVIEALVVEGLKANIKEESK